MSLPLMRAVFGATDEVEVKRWCGQKGGKAKLAYQAINVFYEGCILENREVLRKLLAFMKVGKEAILTRHFPSYDAGHFKRIKDVGLAESNPDMDRVVSMTFGARIKLSYKTQSDRHGCIIDFLFSEPEKRAAQEVVAIDDDDDVSMIPLSGGVCYH